MQSNTENNNNTNQQTKSEVEQFWDATASKFGNNHQWYELNPNVQQCFIQGINFILQAVHHSK